MARPGGPAPHFVKTLQEAVALHRQGRLDEAERAYRSVLRMQRDHFDALHLLGMLNHQRGRHADALRLIDSALKASPRSAEALSNRALVLHALGRSEEALASLDRALAAAPDNPDAHNNRGNILLALGRPAEAEAAFGKALDRAPAHPQARINRASARSALGRHAEALEDLDAALAREPAHPVAHYNRGNALRAAGRESEAAAAYERALAAAPAHVASWFNRGLALQALNRHADALDSFARALGLDPGHADAHFAASMSLLTLGDHRRGWPEYEWRWRRAGMAPRDLRIPLWLGEPPLEGRTILVHAEQGLGDTIQFARYVPGLARLGAKVVLEVQPELRPLLAGLEGAHAVVARGEKLPPCDLHCPIASLPLAMKTEAGTIPAAIPYLRAGEERLARWRGRLEGVSRPRVALAWSGRAAHANDRNRSIALAELAPILSVAGAGFVSVQRDLREADAARLAAAPQVADLGPELGDFADTAAVLALCDLTICVDTSVAHLAGAMGRPLWVLLPFQPDWRWTLDAPRSPWYPAAELFRQPAPGDWAPAIARVREKLASRPMPVT